MAFTPLWGTSFEMGYIPLPSDLVKKFIIGTAGSNNGNYHMWIDHLTGAAATALFPGTLTDTISIGVFTKPCNSWGQTSCIVYAADNNELSGGAISIVLTDGKVITVCVLNGYWCGMVDTTVVATGTLITASDAWSNIQIDCKIADTGGYLNVKVHGATNFSFTGDTKPGTSSTIQYVRLTGRGWTGTGDHWDDLIIGSGGFPGDRKADWIGIQANSTPQNVQRNGISDQTPPAAPTVAVGAAGNLTGAYQYKVSLVDTIGETWAGTASVTVNPSAQKVELSGIATGIVPDTTARKIYRTAAGGNVFKLVGTISDNTTTTFSDDTLDSALGAVEPDKTLNYQSIDETPPSDTDYIYSSVNASQGMYTLTNWDSTAKIPQFLMGWWRAWKPTADAQAIKLLTKSGASSTASATQELTTYAQYLNQLYTKAPDGTDWTDAAIDALEMGIEAEIP